MLKTGHQSKSLSKNKTVLKFVIKYLLTKSSVFLLITQFCDHKKKMSIYLLRCSWGGMASWKKREIPLKTASKPCIYKISREEKIDKKVSKKQKKGQILSKNSAFFAFDRSRNG